MRTSPSAFSSHENLQLTTVRLSPGELARTSTHIFATSDLGRKKQHSSLSSVPCSVRNAPKPTKSGRVSKCGGFFGIKHHLQLTIRTAIWSISKVRRDYVDGAIRLLPRREPQYSSAPLRRSRLRPEWEYRPKRSGVGAWRQEAISQTERDVTMNAAMHSKRMYSRRTGQ